MSSKSGAAAAWKRDNLRIRFPSARSIEETGLDSARCRDDISLFSPHFISEPPSTFSAPHGTMDVNQDDDHEVLESEVRSHSFPAEVQRRKKLGNNRSFRSPSFRFQEGRMDEIAEHAKATRIERRFRKKGGGGNWKKNHDRDQVDVTTNYVGESSSNVNKEAEEPALVTFKDAEVQVDLPHNDEVPAFAEAELVASAHREVLADTLSSPSTSSAWTLEEKQAGEAENENPASVESAAVQPDPVLARNRWRRLRHTVAFANRMASIKNAPTDLLEEKRMEELNEGAGGVGAAAFEGSKTGPQPRLKGRKGMEGLVVRQDKSFIGFIQDFYVACLKIPIGYFLIGVFIAPLALSLLFMPFFLLNIDGLTYDEAMAEQGLIGPLASAKETCLAMLNVFLYALSLSTTFGGSPVIAVSPYCLLVANVNTLMAQFLFVFLSGAVFARMSQPSHPIRCSKKAIIRTEDYIPSLVSGVTDKFRVLSIRLVLTGPPPCELVDAKICLTFRIFVTLPSGSMFCSTQDLEVVRPEVSYLRYGLMVRHIIDKKSPVYGHTNESLVEGDASFSLTVMGLERASMQPIFHLEDYFVYDGDVVWDADYLDFIQINEKGFRVLDHSKIDLLKTFKAAGNVTIAVKRMQREVDKRMEAEKEGEKEERERVSPFKSWISSGIRNRKLWKCMSSSFTRAEW